MKLDLRVCQGFEPQQQPWISVRECPTRHILEFKMFKFLAVICPALPAPAQAIWESNATLIRVHKLPENKIRYMMKQIQ